MSNGDCGGWTLIRQATFADGILRLDRPVMHYSPIIYDALLALRLPGYTYLLPRATLPFLKKRLEEQGAQDSGELHQWVHWHAFHPVAEWERDRHRGIPRADWPLGYLIDRSWADAGTVARAEPE